MGFSATGGFNPNADPPDEEIGKFGDSTDPGIESDEDLDGELDAEGGKPLHHPTADTTDS